MPGCVGEFVEERRVVALRRLELGEVRHSHVVERGVVEGLPRIWLDVRALRHAGYHGLTEGERLMLLRLEVVARWRLDALALLHVEDVIVAQDRI